MNTEWNETCSQAPCNREEPSDDERRRRLLTQRGADVPSEVRKRIMDLHRTYGINHVVFLLDYKYNSDIVNEVLRQHVASLETALRETREALADTLDLATKAAACEMEAIVSTEPGSTVFGCAGISEKAKVARARAAWKALDNCVKSVLARHADLAEGGDRG